MGQTTFVVGQTTFVVGQTTFFSSLRNYRQPFSFNFLRNLRQISTCVGRGQIGNVIEAVNVKVHVL